MNCRYEDVQSIVQDDKFDLIETLAEKISRTVLTNYDTSRVLVRVKKPQVSLPGILDFAGIEISRERCDFDL